MQWSLRGWLFPSSGGMFAVTQFDCIVRWGFQCFETTVCTRRLCVAWRLAGSCEGWCSLVVPLGHAHSLESARACEWIQGVWVTYDRADVLACSVSATSRSYRRISVAVVSWFSSQ